ncbi:MAG: ABC-2 transporter permease [Eubacteriales bacterium]|nr:ABC-2 transporter permease [Eubacteriales bacterium]
MSGLFLKDLLLMGKRRQSLLVFLGIMAVMGFSMGGVFLIGYGTMLFGIFAVGSLSYDDFDNCMPFLLTLPVTRRQYVLGKFLFSASGVALGWVMSIIVSTIVSIIKSEEILILNSALVVITLLPVFIAIISIWIPIEIKFGIEKSRTVMAVAVGCVFLLGLLANKVLPYSPASAIDAINAAPTVLVIGIIIAVCLVILTVTYTITCRILENREY